MSNLVAKRYVRALINGRDIDTISKIQDELNFLSTAFNNEKFVLIISSVDITSEEKVNLLLSFFDNCSDIMKNLIILLGKNRRLNIIPNISSQINKDVATIKNSYIGTVYSADELSIQYLNEIESSLSKKFDVQLSLHNVVGSYDGIKVDIDGLGVEISFSQERLKSQMIDHILKAV